MSLYATEYSEPCQTHLSEFQTYGLCEDGITSNVLLTYYKTTTCIIEEEPLQPLNCTPLTF